MGDETHISLFRRQYPIPTSACRPVSCRGLQYVAAPAPPRLPHGDRIRLAPDRRASTSRSRVSFFDRGRSGSRRLDRTVVSSTDWLLYIDPPAMTIFFRD